MTRHLHPSRPAPVYWITGLSGSGKTTLAHRFSLKMIEAGMQNLLLDGDVLREVFGGLHGHSLNERKQLALSYGKLCHEISRQGIFVICATMSLFYDVQQWNRAHIPLFREIYLRVPLDQLEKRDNKDLYQRARLGEISNMIGIDLPAEFPQAPELVIDNYGNTSADTAFEILWSFAMKKGDLS